MCALDSLRAAVGGLLLGPALVLANGIEAVTPVTQPALTQGAASSPAAATPPAPVWIQMIPAAGSQAYYWVPPPGMTWPVLPQYAAPLAVPAAPAAGWTPFVLMLVPVLPAAPAAVDYGPVADTPVVELPVAESAVDAPPAATELAPAPAAPQGAGPAPAANEPAKEDGGAPAKLPATELQRPAEPDSESHAAAAQPSLTVVDYGPVMPTPVVDLLALQQQTPAPSHRSAGTAKPASKPAAKSSASNASLATSPAPAKKRLCWSKGVVAPCR